MRKCVFWAVLFLTAPELKAAINHRVTGAAFIMDKSLGTFVNNGTTYGYITGVVYAVEAQDSVTLNVCSGSNIINISNPLTSLPTKTVLLNRIQADAAANLKASLVACLAAKNNVSSIEAEQLIVGVDGSAINP